MTTRLYLTTSSAPYTPATTKGTWDDTALAAANSYALGATKAGTNTLLSQAETSTVNGWEALLGRWVSPRLTGGYGVKFLDGATITVARLESNAAANMTASIAVWVTAGDSDTNRGFLIEPFQGATEFATTATAFSFTLTFDNEFTIQPGDRIVVELGYNAANAVATSYTGSIRAGGTAADLATSGTTGATTDSPWIDFTGAGAGAAPFDAALAPLPASAGTGAGTLAFAGAAVGSRTPKATGAGTLAFAGAAVGKRVPQASGSGGWTFAGAAVGSRAPQAAGAGTLAFAGAATGKRAPKATGAGTLAFAGAAVGAAPAPGGTGAGTLAFAGAATGKRAPKATGAGTLAFAGAAVGRRAPKATGAGTLAFAGGAVAGHGVTVSAGLPRLLEVTVSAGPPQPVTAEVSAGSPQLLTAVPTAGPPATP